MRSWLFKSVLSLVVFASVAFGQVGNGTITGTVTDPAGAVVPGAPVEAKNIATGVVFPAVTTNTGSYTIPDLPIGTYEVSTKVQGFKNYVHTGITLAALQVVKEDIALQVGAASESVTVSADASLLKTESSDITHNMSIDQLDDLPLLGIGTANSGTTGVRNPFNSLQTLPGVSSYASSGQFAINGLGAGGNAAMTETMRIEGQDATSRLFGTYDYTQMGQASADAIQEIAYQTSNYAAEYGQAGSVVINMTMKSGTNQYHGTGFDYFVNEDLNAGDPFTINTSGIGKERPLNRRNDFGGTLGGPVVIPKLYNGRNKTFFFFNYEQFLESSFYSFTDTVPTANYLQGNFAAISPNGTCSLCAANGIPTAPITTDPAGNPVYANEVFNPTTRLANGTAMPFPGNIIPTSLFNATSVDLLKLLPQAQNANLIGNYTGSIGGGRYSAIPSIKIDQNISDKDKLSFFYTRINTESQISSPLGNADGLPEEIGGYRGTFIPTYTIRLNYDRTLSPNLLLHLGAGYYHTSFFDHAPFLDFDPASLDLTGFLIHRQFPSFTGLCAQAIPFVQVAVDGCAPGSLGSTGGMQNVGTSGQIQSHNYEEKPTFNASATWIKGAHTFKAGAEMYIEGVLNANFAGVTFATGTGPTSEPFTPTNSLNGQSMGFGFASFLLGDYGTSTAGITQTPQENYRQGNQEYGLYLQDTWKVTRKLTLNYGIRWDYATQYKEQYGRLGQLAATVPNANAGGILGATQYASTCNCQFYQPTYPFALGPRFGLAYQIDDKTVIRGGWGVNYQFVGNPAGSIVTLNGAYPLAGINPFVNVSSPGSIITPTWPDTDPNRFPAPTPTGALTVGGTPAAPSVYVPDANENRPPRVNQFSLSLQREISNNFIVEAAYIGNRGVWEPNGPLGYLSQISPAKYAKYGLYPYPGTGPAGYNFSIPGNSCLPGNDCARALLSLPLTNPAVVSELASAGYPNGITPYPGFAGTTLLSALYPFPQYGNLAISDSPTGNSIYNSLQLKVTKRLSHGLLAGGAYTWAKGLIRENPEDFFNAAGSQYTLQQIPPQAITFNVTYTVPRFNFLNKWEKAAVSDWQVGFFAQYQSGQFLTPPVSTVNAEFLPSEDVRVPGVPLYLVNINDIHSYNPETQQVLNPAAWAPCPVNSTCGGAYNTTGTATAQMLYSDFRGPRQPRENANIGRHFRIKEKYDFYIRAEFVNIFNRTIFPNPTSALPGTPATSNNVGALVSGFGVMNVYQTPGAYPAPTAGATALLGRTGTLIAKFQF
jgi:hypothetical protein